jgi:aminocarboxymuconate-semialdehyde decarboxylase
MPDRVCAKVDIHSHVVSPEGWGQAGHYGPEMVPDGAGGVSIRVGGWQITGGALSKPPEPTMYDPEVRVREMDEAGIDVMGVSPSPLWYLYHAEAEIGVPWAKLNNDLLAKFCAYAPERLFFMATLPMGDVNASLEEVERATDELGARGVNVGTDDIAGRNLDDELFDPIWERLCELDLPLFLHPAPLGISDPDYDHEEAKRRDRLGLSWSAGYIYRETLAVCTLIYGGVLDRFPDLRVCVPHGGGFVPFQIGRFEWYGERSKAAQNARPFEGYLSNFYFDTIIHDPRAQRYLFDIVGPDNLVVGSNWAGWDWVDGFGYAAQMSDDPAAVEKIWGGNAKRLFKLDGFGREVDPG